MKDKIKSLFMSLHTWQIILLSVIGAVLITNLVTILLSLQFWHEVQMSLIVLGTVNAILVPLIMLPAIIRNLKKVIQLEEQNRNHEETILQLEDQRQIEVALQQRTDEMSLLYRLGVSLASGENLYDTLLALQTEIVKFIQVDAFYVAIYNAETDIVSYPIFFDESHSKDDTQRSLHERPGLTGAVIFSGKTIYLPDMFEPEVENVYKPVDDNALPVHTFLGVPLISNGHTIGMLSVQSKQIDAYTPDQIQLIENIAVQAAIAIDKADLLDQLKHELGERTLAEAQLHEREAIFESITFAAEQFLKSSDWRANINQVLERLGKTLKVTHAYLFEDHLNSQGEAVTSMRYEWTADGYPSDLGGPYFQDSKIEQKGFEEQLEALRRGEARIGNSSTYNPIEKESMDDLGVKSILEVPVFVNEREWGAIGFDDLEQERAWNNAEVEALKIAAGVLSGAIQRQDAEATVRESEALYRQAIEAAGAVPYYRDYVKNRYTFMGSEIEKMIGYKPEEITPALWSKILKEHIPAGEATGLSPVEAENRTRKGDFGTWKSDFRVSARNGEERWLTDSSIELFNEAQLSYASIGILQDVTDRKMIEANLRKRESILEAVTFAAEQFLRTSNWRERIDIVLERLGKEFNASHAYLFEKHVDASGVLLNSLRHEWTAPGQRSDLDNPDYQNAPVHEDEFRQYYKILDSGEPFVGGTLYFREAEEEKAWMDSTGIHALLEMRIVVDGRQWGTLGFDDIANEREWTAMEVDVLRIAANVLGAVIKRQLDEEALKNELAERKRTEQALKFSEEKFSKAFQTTQALMTIEDSDHMFIDANKAFMEAFGLERDEIVGHSTPELNILFDPADNQRLRQTLQENGFLKDFEMRIRRKSGALAYVILSSEDFFVDDVQYTLTSGLDITEHKRAEENYRSIFNNSIDGIFQSTDDGRFINVNPAMARIYGYDSPEDMLNSVNDIRTQIYVDAEQRSEVRKLLASGERLIGYETLDHRKDGSTFWASMTAQAVMDENGEALYNEGTIEDVTSRKQAVAEREKLIAETEAKNEELERFTYTVSHDLKSPLVTINGFLGYLEIDAASGNMERLKKDTQRIQEAVNKMQRLLNDLLELSRIGRMMNEPENLAFTDLVREAMDIVHGQLEARGVAVQTQPNLPRIHGDRQRLTEVLQNLIDNAVKYMGTQPSPLIEIGQRGEQEGKPVFYVKDNGMGIAPEFYERVFGLFNKLDPKSEGTGVGLALVKRIIEVHGGKIWIESEPGQGSTFCFTLPVKEESA